MLRIPKIIFCLCLPMLFSPPLAAQTSTAALLRELLELPAPPPKAKLDENNRAESFYDDQNPPADDAPIEDLLDYWNIKAGAYYSDDKKRPTASVKTSLRLIDAVREAPYKFNGFLKIIPVEKEITERVKLLFDLKQSSEDVSDYWRDEVKNWLKFNSDFYVDELLAEAGKVRDKEGYVDKSEILEALVRIDWESAKTVLRKLENDQTNPRAATLAKTLFYRHALEAKDEGEIGRYRDELKAIVTDKKASPYSRDAASDALFESVWKGQDEWYLALMEDESLLFPQEGYRLFTPLTTLNAKNPDKWIPVLTRLVGNKNRAVHNAAVQSLMKFEKRRDALVPLLPWLFDEKWADVPWSPGGRTTLMQIVSNLDLPESIPGLIWIVENEDDNAHWAARSLGEFKDARANPALRNALERIKEETYRQTIVNALLKCSGLTEDEQSSALEFYAEFISKPENLEQIKNRGAYEDENPLPVALSIGRVLSDHKTPGEGLIHRTIERQKILQKEKPAVAKILSGFISKWQNRLIDLEMLRRIEDAEADTETVLGALERRKELKERIPNEIYALRGKNGAAGGFAACLTEDESELTSAFRSENVETRIGTIACARLLRQKLPFEEISRLLDSPNGLLALAAERYLESEDSAEARELIWARHKGEALILGATDSFNPARQIISTSDAPINRLFASVNGAYLYSVNYPEWFRQLEEKENKIRREILENADLLEIYAYQNNFVRVYRDKVIYTWHDDDARFREKILSKKEFADFQRYLIENRIEELSNIRGSCHHECGMSQFIRLSRDGGRRVTAYNAFGQIGGLWGLFWQLRAGEYKIRYAFEKYVSGLEILIADSESKPQMIWKNGDDFRVLVADEQKKNAIDEEIQRQDKLDDADENLDYAERGKRARARRMERAFEPYEWREFRDGKLGKLAAEPAEIPFLREKLAFPAVEDLASNDNPLQARTGNYEIRAGEFNFGDLWKMNRAERVKIGSGTYTKPVVTPEGKWAVAAKTASRYDAPHGVVRVNLQTGREYKIKLPDAEAFYPAAFIAEHQKVLLYHGKTDYSTLNPTPADYYLLDPETGKIQPVKGEFQPFLIRGFRPLQSNGKPDQYWAAIYSRAKNETAVGIYNARDFSFRSVLRLPEILFDSGDLWVDEKEGGIYLIYADDFRQQPHLLKFDLPR